MKLILAAAALALLSIGGAQAADPVVPITGSAQGITVPLASSDLSPMPPIDLDDG